jgi:UDP-4-amino-4,6-dideoxy-N-acetyl-beta-L-altrosamine transaminase
MIPYSRQYLFLKDIKNVNKVLRSAYLTQGIEVPKFEQKIANYCKSKYVVAVNSATSALHLTCLALGLNKKEYLWTVPITFVASSNCGLYCGAKIDFVDIEYDTFNINLVNLEKKLEIAKKQKKLPKIIIPVHFGGNPCDLKKLSKLAKKYKFKIVEDASHALGSKYNKHIIGNCRFSDAVVFSFHPVKSITTGEGGAVICKNKKIYEKIKMLREHGIVKEKKLFYKKIDLKPWYYEQQALGFNYRMSDISASLGSSQLSHLDLFIKRRNNIAQIYENKLNPRFVTFQKIEKNSISARHLFIIKVNKKLHNKFFNFLRKKKVYVQLHYIPIYKQPFYKKNFKFNDKNFPNSEKYYSEAISIPIFFDLSYKQQIYIINLINSFFYKIDNNIE